MKYILFPHTDLFSLRQLPFFLLAPQISLFRPATPKKESDITECFIKAGFCQAEYQPFATTVEEQHFLHLQKELYANPQQFSRQLSHLAVAGRTAAAENGEQSNRAIRKNIEAERPIGEDKDKEALWQARLLVSVAELNDREEEEVAAQMAQAEHSTQKLLAELQGEEEAEILLDTLQRQQGFLHFTDRRNIAPRVNAWRQLFADRMGTGDLFLTQDKDAAELLIEEYEQEIKEAASPIGELPLPLFIGTAAEEALPRVAAFHKAYPLLQKRLLETVWTEELSREWAAAIDALFPAALYGRQKIAAMRFHYRQAQQLSYPERILYTAA